MRTLPLFLASLVLLTGAARAPPGTPADAPKRTVLRGPDCLDPAGARGWHYVDDDELVVDAGRRKYRIHLTGFCTELGSATGLKFEGDSVSGRICGNVGDSLRFRRTTCRIDRMELIDADAYRVASERKQGRATIAEPVD